MYGEVHMEHLNNALFFIDDEYLKLYKTQLTSYQKVHFDL